MQMRGCAPTCRYAGMKFLIEGYHCALCAGVSELRRNPPRVLCVKPESQSHLNYSHLVRLLLLRSYLQDHFAIFIYGLNIRNFSLIGQYQVLISNPYIIDHHGQSL